MLPLLIDQLRERAIHIGNVTEDYEIEIEDVKSESGMVFFTWKHKDDAEMDLWIELTLDGRLESLLKDSQRSKSESILSEDQLKVTALSFANDHIPSGIDKFKLEEWKSIGNGRNRLSYVQYQFDLPLPFTGFYLDIHETGEIINYRYYGSAENIRLPDTIIDKEVIKAEYLSGLEMELLITELSSEIYDQGNDLPHLVYEPNWQQRYNPDEGKMEKQPVNEEWDSSERLETIFRPEKKGSKTIDQLIGFDENTFEQIRETDMGDVTGIVWRKKDFKDSNEDDLTMDGYFHKRNDGTLKMKIDKGTGKLSGVYSFLERQGDLNLSYNRCRELAEQMLFTLYPEADQYFKLVVLEEELEEESNLVHFEYRLFFDYLPIRFGSVKISVNRTTGTIDHYMSSDVNQELLINLNAKPVISEAEAIKMARREFDVELKWNKEYTDNQDSYYVLTYVPSFPNLKGELAFIDAQTGELVLKYLNKCKKPR